MRRWQFAIGSVAFAMAGCVSSAGSSAAKQAAPAPSLSPTLPAAAAIVPWSSQTPAPLATPSPTTVVDAPVCQATQLDAGDGGWEGATGSLLGGFLIRNTSHEPCRLEGRPAIKIVDAEGRSLDVRTVPAPSPSPRPIVLGPKQAAPVLNEEPSRGLASETLQWFNWCGSAPKEPLKLTVTLPEGGVLRVPISFGGGTPRCDEPTAPSVLSVAPFEETSGPSATEPPAVPAQSLELTLVVPEHATAGQRLDYVAILTNHTTDPIALDPCPAYEERLNTSGGPVVGDYILACATVPVIAPGASVRFAMELNLPVALPPDDQAALVWGLDPFHSQGFPPQPPEQKVPIRVVAP
ncbi:MAG TPA: DUF4232 domain-containing protein [Candidatus Limnocylindria bacterium]|nr:DUF4232 domain-containing protein [Candidatus Limnocylindria bacterium]